MSDRKYRHRGYGDTYHDSNESETRRKPGGPRPDPTLKPRGRGLGAPDTTVFRCRDCGAKQVSEEPVASDSTCPKCGAALHSCVNCGHFDTASRYECRKPIPQPQRSKSKGNSCEFFAPKQAQEFGADSSEATDARSAFDALFKL